MSRTHGFVASLAVALASGCASQGDVNRATGEHLEVSGRLLGFALDAQLEVLELELALLRRDPAFATQRGASEAQLLAKLERVRGDQKLIQDEVRRLKAKYAGEERAP